MCCSGCSVANKEALEGVVRTTEQIIGCQLPSLEDITNSHYRKRTKKHYQGLLTICYPLEEASYQPKHPPVDSETLSFQRPKHFF